ncbi:dephospho-CoA kinase [Bacteriovorax stolpii]|uniref:Dephospho-CoA kinase n=1 Tax=Bacteriovorax stolpii TaxID=960 RepID=A0A2K9NV92_BACTC|nr:dephospho-CoA kinase [Bacteriovorax stolpii]AUN99426.1 dephospho-CoA kinase [Bacteriovorax stolpii]QDK40595.1 dephospho-CoA kinase [Bacteriovorax stolpii]TDP55031.1 dephospho-CoA kinase [Bacteriovorax stolpii]
MKKLKSKWITKDQSSRLYNIPVPIVALTGGIATGKSTVAQMFRDENIPVIDADRLVKGIYSQKESFDFVFKNFKDAIIDEAIHFKTLRELAFKTPENQLLLETYIYSRMPDAFSSAYGAFEPHGFVVYDVPLLFEKKLNEKTDLAVCTYAPRSIQLERLVKRDNISTELAENILSKQMDIEEKKKRSDLFIENMADFLTLEKNFRQLLTTLCE